MHPAPRFPWSLPRVAAALLVLAGPAILAAPKPDRIKARHEAVEATLTPTQPFLRPWLQERILPGQMIRETEDLWAAQLAQDPPVENVPGKKSGAERKRERDDLTERRDVFLACFARDRAHELYRFSAGAGKPFGYVIFKQGQPLFQYQVGVNPEP